MNRRGVGVTGALIATLYVLFFVFSWALASLFFSDAPLSLPLPVRAGGALLVAWGVGVLWELRKHRPFRTIASSTAQTLLRFLTKGSTPPPTEPLVVEGPHRLVRHPMYHSILSIVLGSFLLLGLPFLLFAFLVLLFWYRAVVIPIEERELSLRFGARFEEYRRSTPALLPLPRIRSKKA